MNSRLILLFLFLAPVAVFAQNLSLEYAVALIGNETESIKDFAVDSNGNVYLTGAFRGSLDFDPSTASHVVTSNGLIDAYILKLDSLGRFKWVHTFGGEHTDIDEDGVSINLDKYGNVIVVGKVSGTVDFSTDSIPNTVTTTQKRYAIFTLSMSPTGNLNWVKATKSAAYSILPYSLAVDNDGNSYTLCQSAGSITIDGIKAQIKGVWNSFIYKLDHNGNAMWIRPYGREKSLSSSSLYTYGTDLTVNAKNELFLSGSYRRGTEFETKDSILIFDSSNEYGAFIAKMADSGNCVWAKVLNQPSYDSDFSSMLTSQEDDIYLTGQFKDTMDFDPSANEHILVAEHRPDARSPFNGFLLKLDSVGDFVWVNHVATSGYSTSGKSLAIDNFGNIYATGLLRGGTATFKTTSDSYSFDLSSTSDSYIWKCNSLGQLGWVRTIDNHAASFGKIKIKDTSILVSGVFGLSVDFDLDSNRVKNLYSNTGSYDLFLAKYGQANLCQPSTYPVVDSTMCHGVSFTSPLGSVVTIDSSFTERYINKYGCDSLVPYNLAFTKVDTRLNKKGESVEALATNATFQWFDCEDNFLPIADKIDYLFSPDSSGTFAVEIIQETCLDTSNCVEIEVVPLSIKDFYSNFVVYPNPTSGLLILKLDNIEVDKVELLNSKGQILNTNSVQNRNQLELEINQPCGLYFIKIVEPSGNSTLIRVVKQ